MNRSTRSHLEINVFTSLLCCYYANADKTVLTPTERYRRLAEESGKTEEMTDLMAMQEQMLCGWHSKPKNANYCAKHLAKYVSLDHIVL